MSPLWVGQGLYRLQPNDTAHTVGYIAVLTLIIKIFTSDAVLIFACIHEVLENILTQTYVRFHAHV